MCSRWPCFSIYRTSDKLLYIQELRSWDEVSDETIIADRCKRLLPSIFEFALAIPDIAIVQNSAMFKEYPVSHCAVVH
jgi:hypothetical protein